MKNFTRSLRIFIRIFVDPDEDLVRSSSISCKILEDLSKIFEVLAKSLQGSSGPYKDPWRSSVFWVVKNVVQSERGNQRDGLWLARIDLATHSSHSNIVGFRFSSRASSGSFGWIFDWKVREESWIFWPLCCQVWKRSDVTLGGKMPRRWNPFNTRFPPLSFYYYNFYNSQRRTQIHSKSLKKPLLRQKDDCTCTSQVR